MDRGIKAPVAEEVEDVAVPVFGNQPPAVSVDLLFLTLLTRTSSGVEAIMLVLCVLIIEQAICIQ